MTAIVIWVIGWLFTMGLSWEDEFEGQGFRLNVIDGIIALGLWPVLLGQEVNMRFRRDGKVYKS